ncbi:MAG: FAD-binding protein [Actinobacteria bacterium]|nr:FAD-binding protein [Actinomycetota bacterium]
MRTETAIDPKALAADLSAAVAGPVRFSPGSRALYAVTGSNYRQVPIGVVVPRDVDDVVAAVEVCRRHGAPVLPRGGGTSLAGQSVNVAVVVDMSMHMRGVLELDPHRRSARVQPGVVLDRLRDDAEEHGLTFAPDPSTHVACTLGGMIGNNSCGVHSLMAGRTVDNVEELEILTYDGLRLRVGPTSDEELGRIVAGGGRRGDIYERLRALRDRYGDLVRERYPDIPRRVSGYNLDELLPERGFNVARALVGTEGTCVTVLEATLRLVPSPPHRALLILCFGDVFAAAEAVPAVLEHGPIGLEGFDDVLVDNMQRVGIHPDALRALPAGQGWLLAEFGADTPEEANERAERAKKALLDGGHVPAAQVFDDEDHVQKLWTVREAALAATSHVPGQAPTWEGWEDAAVPPDRLAPYLRDFRELLDGYGYVGALYGHFGQGCIHTRIDYDLASTPGIAKFRSFTEDAADLVLSYGGSLSGEHGDGQSRAELLPRMFGDELVGAFGEFKTIWDPEGRMNPRKVVDPYRLDDNLRLGADYDPPQLDTHFAYGRDGGSFAKTTLRCVGVGLCRKTEGGTMCPSYRATLEEKHSTRGRARLLFELLEGDPVRDGWRNEEVHEALDLCLACKACRSECPVSVDMASYKAEFLSHHYRRRLRPLHAYVFGLVYWGARAASLAPGVANFFAGTAPFSSAIKRVVGIAPERSLPPFAPETFRRWFARRAPRAKEGRRVLLWPDTFNNHFHPDTAKAAVHVLEAAGYRVELPPRPLCCGRPLYDYGMLDTAERLLRQVLDALRPQIRAGIPLVGLEPSCVAVFRDELLQLLPDDEDAKRLAAQSFLLSEFLEQRTEGYRAPQLSGKAVVHGHCHHKAIMTMDAEENLLEQTGLDFELLDAGCCGMAGAFGFERGEHYDVSIKAGEQVLLPAVRAAADDTLVIANGFSCREQIVQTTGRRALHLAEVLQLGLTGREEVVGETRAAHRGTRLRLAAAAAVLGALALAVRER